MSLGRRGSFDYQNTLEPIMTPVEISLRAGADVEVF